MKTTRRGLFGLIAGIAGTLALGKAAPEAARVEKMTSEPSYLIYANGQITKVPDREMMWSDYAFGTEYTPREVGVKVSIPEGIFSKQALFFIEPIDRYA